MKVPARIDDKYEVLSELARGGMGVVFRARDTTTDREVALKLTQGGGLSERQRERFRREGVMAAGLDHPGIVRVHASGEHDGQPYLVQELVPEAQTLEEVFRERSRDERVALVLEAARAVGHAHTHGVIHRDLKPPNLLVGSDGRVRVADFGLAHRADLDHLTKTGELLGTPTHMAPEQFNGAVGVEAPATDVWALGVTLYQALTGELPFQGVSLMELAGRVEAATPSSPRNAAPKISPQLEAVCLRALQRIPADRFPDANAFADALERAPRSAGLTLRPAWLLGLVVLIGLAAAVGHSRPSPADASPTALPSAPAPPSGGETSEAPARARSSDLRPLARLTARGDELGQPWFVGEARFVILGKRQLRLYRIDRRGGKTRLVHERSAQFGEPLKVFNDSPEQDSFDLIQVTDRPWVFSRRTTAELFARARLEPKLDLRRDVALVFQPHRYARARMAVKETWALLELRSDGERRIHAVRRLRSGQVAPMAQISVGKRTVSGLSLSPRGHQLVLVSGPARSNPRHVQLHALPSGRKLWRIQLSADANLLRFSHVRDQLVAGTKDGTLLVFAPPEREAPIPLKAETIKTLGYHVAHRGPVLTGTFSTDGRTLVSLSRNPLPQGVTTSVRCWDTTSWKELPAGRVSTRHLPRKWIACSPNDRYLLFAGQGALELWSFGLAHRE